MTASKPTPVIYSIVSADDNRVLFVHIDKMSRQDLVNDFTHLNAVEANTLLNQLYPDGDIDEELEDGENKIWFMQNFDWLAYTFNNEMLPDTNYWMIILKPNDLAKNSDMAIGKTE